jgi:hypothetical protein
MAELTDDQLLERAKNLETIIQTVFRRYGGEVPDADECLKIAGTVTWRAFERDLAYREELNERKRQDRPAH